MNNDKLLLDGYYTQNQIDAIRNIKSKKDEIEKVTNDDNIINCNKDTICDDIVKYQKNGELDDIDEENQELVEYIENTIGINNLVELLDKDGDGDPEEGVELLAQYALGNDVLNKRDINWLIKNVMDLDSAVLGEEDGVDNVEYVWDKEQNDFVEKEEDEDVDEEEDDDEEHTYEYDPKVGEYFTETNIKSKDQINAISAIKGNESKYNRFRDDETEGNLDSFKDDINNYKSGKESKNKALLDYIDRTVGVENFRKFINSKGKLEAGDAEMLADYFDDGKLTSKDINAIIDDIMDMDSVSIKENGKTVEYEFDEDGEAVEKGKKEEDDDDDDKVEITKKKGDYLDGYYTEDQKDIFQEILNLKDKDIPSNDKIPGNVNTVVEDLKTYLKNSSTKTDNKKLFDYIDEIIDIEDFVKLLDTNEDGRTSNEELQGFASYATGKEELTSKDVNEFIKDIRNLTKIKVVENGKEVEYEVKDGKFVKKESDETGKNTKIRDYYLDDEFAKDQINALNDVKTKTLPFWKRKDNITGDIDKFKEDIDNYKKNEKTDDVSKKNRELFEYIDDVMDLDNFLELLDANGDGDISRDEAKKIASYCDDADGLTSKDINLFFDDIQSLTKDIKVKNSDGTTTTWVYDKDKKQYVEKSEKPEDTKPKDTDTEKYNEDGTLKEKIDKEKGFRTEYTYKDGKLVSSTTISEDGNVTMHECTYDDKGRVKTKHEYVSEEYGTAGEFTHKYTYVGDTNKVQVAEVYKGNAVSDNNTSSPIGRYEYEYKDDEKKPSSRTNTTNGEKSEFTYEDNKLKKAQVTKNNSLVCTNNYNNDGTIKSIANSNTTALREYEKPYVSKVTTYNNSDIDSSGNAKSGATPVSIINYIKGKAQQANNGNSTGSNQATQTSLGSSIPSALAERVDKKLGTGFCAKLNMIAAELKCSPLDLLVMMYSESGLNASDNNGNTAGLTQFLPDNAAAQNITLDQLANMSAIEQLDYIKKDLLNAKALRYSSDDSLDAGALYAVNFLPAYAKDDVLCEEGDTAYNDNRGLDENNDGKITKQDLADHLAKKYEEMKNDSTI